MRDGKPASRRGFALRCGLDILCWVLALAGSRRAELPPEGVDDCFRRDIGLATDGRIGVGDVRTAFYRKMLETGQPLA